MMMMMKFAVVLVLAAELGHAAAAVVDDGLHLYANSPLVTEFLGDEDTDFRESRMARIVQFYSPFCVSDFISCCNASKS